MKDLKHLIQLINSYPSDIRAEVMMADLMEEGFTHSDFLVFFNSLFKRGYSKDLLFAEKILINELDEVLAIYLSRDGLYDLLPEGLFHVSPEAALKSGKDMALNSRKENTIEEETRKFFRPFENEFFYQRIQLELEERSVLEKLNDNALDGFFLDFWKIDSSLPEKYILKLCSMLPFVRQIVGNFSLTANALGAILGEEVSHEIHYSSRLPNSIENDEVADGAFLGGSILGTDTVTAGHFTESYEVIKFAIGPLRNTGIDPYLDNGEIALFIDCFCDFFIPVELEQEFEVILGKEQEQFTLIQDANQPVLGYSTNI